MKRLRATTILTCLAVCAPLVGCSTSHNSSTVTPNVCNYVPARNATRLSSLLVSGAKPRRGFTVGFVTDTGRLGDKSFNDLTNAGLRDAEARFGVKGAVIQTKSSGDYVKNLTHFAAARTGLTVAVGVSMGSAVYNVARIYPKADFAIVDGSPLDASNRPVSLPNVANVYFAEQQSGFLAGVIAGLMEKNRVGKATHNTIGFLGGQSIPPVNHYVAGYVSGARCVNRNLKIIGQYAGTFDDPVRGHALGQAQIRKGADILFQVAAITGIGYVDAAKSSHAYAIGVDADQSYLGSEVITTAVKRVDVAVRDTILNAASGHFRAGDQRFTAADGAVGIAKPATVVPARFMTQVQRFDRLMAEGRVVPPSSVPRY